MCSLLFCKRFHKTGSVWINFIHRDTPARTFSICGLKSRVLKLSFLSLKMMVNRGLEFILKFTKPLQRYLLSCQANSAILGWYFCTGQQQLWRGSMNFKIMFKQKNGNFKTPDFSPLIKRVLAGVESLGFCNFLQNSVQNNVVTKNTVCNAFIRQKHSFLNQYPLRFDFDSLHYIRRWPKIKCELKNLEVFLRVGIQKGKRLFQATKNLATSHKQIGQFTVSSWSPADVTKWAKVKC